MLKESQSTRLSQEHIPSYLGWAIAVTILCSLIFGIIAIIYSVKVGERLRNRDYAGARDSSKKAKMWCWISFGETAVVMFMGLMFALVCSG